MGYLVYWYIFCKTSLLTDLLTYLISLKLNKCICKFANLKCTYILVRQVFKGDNYSREETIRGNTVYIPSTLKIALTLKSLIEEHACLDLSDFLSTLLAIFHVINEKFPPARLSIYLVISKQVGTFFPSLLVYFGLLFY